MKESNGYTVSVRSRHPSHRVIRGTKLSTYPHRVIVRLGSLTPTKDVYPVAVQKGYKIVEINTPEAISVSANKLKMKQAFDKAGVKTAQWWIPMVITATGRVCFHKDNNDHDNSEIPYKDMPFPLVAKHIFGSRGTGNHLLHNSNELESFLNKCKDKSKYIFEKYYDYNREYRLHVNKDGCFYTCRKMLKEETPKEKRWFRNDSNSVWIKEDNELFDRPTTWNAIVDDCVKALASVGLDFGAFDVRVQSSTKKNKKSGLTEPNPNPEWIIIESNSAPSFGEVTAEKYLEMLPKLIKDKANAS